MAKKGKLRKIRVSQQPCERKRWWCWSARRPYRADENCVKKARDWKKAVWRSNGITCGALFSKNKVHVMRWLTVYGCLESKPLKDAGARVLSC